MTRNRQFISRMRRLVVVLCAVLVAAYGTGAYYFFVQERWARGRSANFDENAARHPETMLVVARTRLAENRYEAETSRLLTRAILEAPSFYEGPFLLAAYRENRLESPGSVRAAYEAAIARFPANGRLHLAYASWLLDSRADLSAWYTGVEPARPVDPLLLAEVHLASAMRLEPDLASGALRSLSEHRVPPQRWLPLVPEHPLARRHLVHALFQSGYSELGWQRLRESPDEPDPRTLRRAVQRGLQDGDAELALAAAERWMERIESGPGVSSELIEPTLWLARSLLALEQPERAYEALAGALDRVDTSLGRSSRVSLELLCAFGEEYLRLGQPLSAEAWFEEAASRSSSHAPALYGLARSRRASGDPFTAADYYERVLRLEPGHSRARSELGAARRELAGR